MTAVLAFLLPILLRAAETGTLLEIVETTVKLIRLVLPLVEQPAIQADLRKALVQLQPYVIRPAQPGDPALDKGPPDIMIAGG